MIEEKSSGVKNQEEAKKEVKAAKEGTTIYAKIFAPFQEYFEGECTGISAVNESGPFDVLARHHNFITMLIPCNLVVHLPEGDQTFKITRGLMHVRNSKVIVFLDV
ncbi:MAG TPA: hypothetical protein VD735_00175 [Candidatus Saccharimonadales bacterium]|nr:hypothetical protein [Candidatus Saccharimonadales bacterium]